MPVIKHAEASSMARDAIVLDLGDLDREATRLRAQAEARAEEVVADAKAERKRLIAGADERGYAEGFERRRQAGLEEGRSAGRAEAVASAQSRFAELASRWEAALAVFAEAREPLLASARRDVVRLGALIGERITRRVVAADSEQVARTLDAVLGVLLEPTRLVVRVHPDDAVVTAEVLPTLIARFAREPDAQIDEDAALERGSCVVRTDKGEIDASIDAQIDRVVDAVLEGFEAAGPNEGADEAEA